MKSSSLSQSFCAPLNPYGRQYHCEKEILFCIHDKSILLLGHLGAHLIHRKCLVDLLNLSINQSSS